MPIITISRQMGTGAYQIAKDIAKKLKYTLIDGTKIAELAPKYGLTPEILERVDEKPPAFRTADDRLNAAHLYTAELILLECCREGNVVLYGRGGQDLLVGMGNLLRLRFIAPFDDRVENFAEREWLDPDLARELIRKNDHQRGGFIHFYFNRDWNDPLGYDLVINTSKLSRQTIVDTIVATMKDPNIKEAREEGKALLEEKILSKKVETALLKNLDHEFLHYQVQAAGSDVTVSGHVNSEDERSSALRCAAKVKGVKKVIDNLQVMNYKPYKD